MPSRTALAAALAPEAGMVLAKAALRAAGLLGLSGLALGQIIGLSEASVSRLKSGALVLREGDKSFELAVLFLRLYRALDAVTGGDAAMARAWLKSPNLALGAVPLLHIRQVAGLVETLACLDAARARI